MVIMLDSQPRDGRIKYHQERSASLMNKNILEVVKPVSVYRLTLNFINGKAVAYINSPLISSSISLSLNILICLSLSRASVTEKVVDRIFANRTEYSFLNN